MFDIGNVNDNWVKPVCLFNKLIATIAGNPKVYVARRKEIKGIAFSIADKFISRYNDIGGYWAIGKFYALAAKNDTTVFRYNILTNTTYPRYPSFEEIRKPYSDMLIQQGESRGLVIVDAIIEITFESEFAPEHRPNFGFKEYMKKFTRRMEKVEARFFICRVTLKDDLGKKWIGESKGWCWKHNPKKEHRSTRVNLLRVVVDKFLK